MPSFNCWLTDQRERNKPLKQRLAVAEGRVRERERDCEKEKRERAAWSHTEPGVDPLKWLVVAGHTSTWHNRCSNTHTHTLRLVIRNTNVLFPRGCVTSRITRPRRHENQRLDALFFLVVPTQLLSQSLRFQPPSSTKKSSLCTNTHKVSLVRCPSRWVGCPSLYSTLPPPVSLSLSLCISYLWLETSPRGKTHSHTLTYGTAVFWHTHICGKTLNTHT